MTLRALCACGASFRPVACRADTWFMPRPSSPIAPACKAVRRVNVGCWKAGGGIGDPPTPGITLVDIILYSNAIRCHLPENLSRTGDQSTPSLELAMSIDFLIIGGGIGGAVLANLLGRSGKRVVVLEKSQTTPPQARPEILWPATVEILRSLLPKSLEERWMLPIRGFHFTCRQRTLLQISARGH